MIMDSLRYWVLEMHVDGFRFDLARRWRGSSTTSTAWRLFRHHSAGPGDLSSQTDCRALGPGAGRLPGRQFSGSLGRMECDLPRHRAALLERRRGQVAGLGFRLDRIERSYTPTTAGCPTPASILSPPTTASRCTIWSATTTNIMKPTAKKTATATMKISVGIAAPKGRPMILSCSRCANGKKEIFSRRCCCLKACRCYWLAMK